MRDIEIETLRKLETDAKALASAIDHFLNNGVEDKDKRGFGLFVFSFDGPETTWVSNAERKEMVSALEELLTHWKSGHRFGAIERAIKSSISGSDITGGKT